MNSQTLGNLSAARMNVLIRQRPAGQLVYHRNIEVAIKRQAECARNGRGGHHEQMRITAFAHELFALRHTELVLLVNDYQAEIRQLEAGGEQGVGSDEQS